MSAMMKPAKEFHETGVGQPTAACQVMVCPSRSTLVTMRTVTLTTSSRDKLRRAMLSCSPSSSRWSVTWRSRCACFLACVRAGLPRLLRLLRLPREACYDQERGQSEVEKDTVTLNEEQGEVHPRRKDKTPNAPWVASGVRSVVARLPEDVFPRQVWRAMLLFFSLDQPTAEYWPHGEVAAPESGRRKSQIAASLPREACFDGYRWRLACGASLPVAIDAMNFTFRF